MKPDLLEICAVIFTLLFSILVITTVYQVHYTPSMGYWEGKKVIGWKNKTYLVGNEIPWSSCNNYQRGDWK